MLRWLKWPAKGDGSSVGHYRITKKLGAGGMGVVYAALDERLGRTVAVKMISGKGRDEKARERLRREARAAARVNHPNVCQVHEIGEQAGDPYIVMELLEGESLAERLARGALPVAEATRVALELLEGLGALHRQGLLHRDLKPSNVFLTDHGVKLLDFGLVRRERLDPLMAAGTEPSLTATGTLVGTPRYMSPEQVEGRELDVRSDVFAVGAILYEMLSGRPAFPGQTPVQVLHGILYETPLPLEGPADLVSACQVAARALAKNPEERLGSAEAMAEALRAGPVSTGAREEPTELRPSGSSLDESLTAAHQALARRAWPEAFELLSKAEASGASLAAEDLDSLGEAAVWTNHPQESIDARQRAFAAYMRDGQPRRAALVALGLVINYFLQLNHSVAAGWLNKARRLLEEQAEGNEHGYLAVTETMVLCAQGELDAAVARARDARECGCRHGDPDLQALGLTLEGFALVRQGQTSEGMSLLDEAMAGTLGGALGPFATAVTYCRTIGVCVDLFDYRRGLEWTKAVERCAVGSQPSGISGDCRVHHATLLKVRGEWSRAADEALIASAETEMFCATHSSMASYEIGEIRLKEGDYDSAEAAFRQAHERGLAPQPGLALLRLAQGRSQEAAAGIAEALSEAGGDRLRRAHLLPAQVEIALAAGDVATARASATELSAIAEAYGTTALVAVSECALGVVAAAEDQPDAVERLRRAHRLFLDAETPYDAARARLRLSEALLAQGHGAAAAQEAEAARSQFDRLGARPDALRASEVQRVADRGPA